MPERKEVCEHLAPSESSSSTDSESYAKKKKKYLNRKVYEEPMKTRRFDCSKIGVYLTLFMIAFMEALLWKQVLDMTINLESMRSIPEKISELQLTTTNYSAYMTLLLQNLPRRDSEVDNNLRGISNRISVLSLGLNNIKMEQERISKNMNFSQEITDVPMNLRSLMTSVASIGSQMDDFNNQINNCFNELKNISSKISEGFQNLRENGGNDTILKFSDLNETLWTKIKKMAAAESALHESITKIHQDFQQLFPSNVIHKQNLTITPSFSLENLLNFFPEMNRNETDRFNLNSGSTKPVGNSKLKFPMASTPKNQNLTH